MSADIRSDGPPQLIRKTENPPKRCTLSNEAAKTVAQRARTKASVPPDPNTLLTLDQAATRLNTTANQVKRFIEDGELRFVNVGRGPKRPRYRITNGDLDALVESRTKQEHPCRSIDRKSLHRNIGLTSRPVVVGFMARHAALLSARPKSLKP